MVKKSERKANFTSLEVDTLLQNVYDHRAIIFCQHSAALRSECWSKIATNINALGKSPCLRTLDMLKIKWTNIKSSGIKELSDHKRHMQKTGG